MAAPWGKELDECRFAGFEDYFVEVGRDEVEDCGGGEGKRGQEGEGGNEARYANHDEYVCRRLSYPILR